MPIHQHLLATSATAFQEVYMQTIQEGGAYDDPRVWMDAVTTLLAGAAAGHHRQHLIRCIHLRVGNIRRVADTGGWTGRR
jgi:hypothetical protein